MVGGPRYRPERPHRPNLHWRRLPVEPAIDVESSGHSSQVCVQAHEKKNPSCLGWRANCRGNLLLMDLRSTQVCE